jgi:uncharacterized membrane protein YfcA
MQLLGIDLAQIAGLLGLGVCTGLLSGLLGIGGGMIMVPFVDAFLAHRGLPPEHSLRMAIATSLATIAFTSVSSMRAHHRRGGVRWDIVRRMAPGILCGSAVGAVVAAHLRTPLLLAWFGLFLAFTASQMLVDRKPRAERQLPGGAGLLAVGSVIGALSSVVGAGGAFITVPFLVWSRIAPAVAIGTSAACGFPIAIAGTSAYIISGWSLHMPVSLGYLHVPALLTISTASMLSAPRGAALAHRLPTVLLRRIFAFFLILLAAYMLWRAVRA